MSAEPVPSHSFSHQIGRGGLLVVECYNAQTPDEAMATIEAFMEGGALGAPVEKLLVEEYLEGREVSLLGLVEKPLVLSVADLRKLPDWS